jgi:beta-ureidopropionase
MERDVLKVAGIQLGSYLGDYERQIDYITNQCERLLNKNRPDILCLPEVMTTPYFCTVRINDYQKYAETLPGPTSDRIADLAKKYRTHIIGTVYEHDSQDGKYYNSAFISSDTGETIGKYRKTHIPYIDVPGTKGLEKLYFSPGNEIAPFKIKDQTIGILICYDRSFPEAWRALTLRGTKVIFVPASSSGFRSQAFIEELRIRAMENGVFVVAVNKYGPEKMVEESEPKTFYGKSCVIDPFGNIMKTLEDEANLSFQVELPLRMVEEARDRLAYFRDRRPELYGAITERDSKITVADSL